MQLSRQDIHTDPRLCSQVKKLYHQAFPKEERIPWWLLALNSRRKDIDLTAWLEDGNFCGLTASVTVNKQHFILFLAVAEHCRDRGCGSAILKAVTNAYDSVTLNVEPLDPAAENYAQRQRRFAFYQRNGFYDTGYHVWEVGGMFRVLSTRTQLDPAVYKVFFRRLSLGLWDVKLEKAE